MKLSLSTLIGILLLGGALALHFSKQAPRERSSNPKVIYTRTSLEALPPAPDFTSPSQSYREAETLALSVKNAERPRRQKALLETLAILYRIQTENAAWQSALIERRIEQTIISLLALQRNT